MQEADFATRTDYLNALEIERAILEYKQRTRIMHEPKDLRGCPIREGDIVLIPCRVTALRSSRDAHAIVLATEVERPDNGHKTTLHVCPGQIIVEDDAPELVEPADDGETSTT